VHLVGSHYTTVSQCAIQNNVKYPTTFVSSLHSLPHDRSTALHKAVLHTVRSGARSFNLQYSRFSLRSSSRCLCLLRRLLVTADLPSFFLKRFIAQRVFIAYTSTNYKIVPFTNTKKCLHYGTSETEVHGYKYVQITAVNKTQCDFPSFYLAFNNVFWQAVPTQDVAKPLSFPSFLLYARYPSTRRHSNIFSFSHNRSK